MEGSFLLLFFSFDVSRLPFHGFSKHPLALSDAQGHISLLPDICRQRLANPDITFQAEVPGSLPQSCVDLPNLLFAQPPWTPGSLPPHEPGQSPPCSNLRTQ